VDEIVRAEAAQGIEIVDAATGAGSYYRGDHPEFARVGVPVAYLAAGKEVIGHPYGCSKQQEEATATTTIIR
jgi:hypothetical protein